MISILMPAYIDNTDRLGWLNETIESVKSQFFEDWELILMDDASPVTIQIGSPDERIRTFRMVRRSGPSLCRNTAARVARYDCLLPLDADDLLPGPDILGTMHTTWRRDPTKIIYGNIRRMMFIENRWQVDKEIDFPDYTFQKCLDLNGIMTVSSMHSMDCHLKAGGWKPELEAGLEDVEYFISAGKAGFCGQHLHETVLIYRKHENSRSSQLRTGNRRETEMRNVIREMHKDVYEGRFPMGCCGGGKPYVPPGAFTQSSVAMPTTLDKFPTDQKVWVEYKGQREAAFGMVGQFTNISYNIDGPGHKIEVHINDLPKFRRSGRGLDFLIGVGTPNGAIRPVEPVRGQEPEFRAAEPQVAQIERLDAIAA